MNRQKLLRHGRSALAVVIGLGAAVGLIHFMGAGCQGWDPSDPLTHNSPEVDEAIRFYDAGELEPAAQVLTRYLGTGPCSKEGLGLTDMVRKRRDGSFDLGLTLFRVGERYGKPFGDEEEGRPPGPPDPKETPTEEDQNRSLQIDCALVVTKAIASDPATVAELRARAWYLAGNLEFLRRKYEDAVKSYDNALKIVPGLDNDAEVDAVGRDAAWNRSIALRRIEEQKDAGAPDAEPDAEPEQPDADDAGPDAEPDAGPDAEPDAGPDGGDQGDKGDAGPDGGDQSDKGDAGADAGPDGGGDPQDDEPDAGDDEPDAGGQDPKDPKDQNGEPQPGEPDGEGKDPDRKQGERVLDQFEEAPTYQEQEAKRKAGRGRRTMEDK